MLVAYLESIKYVGHMFPAALLRIYIGWSFFMTAWMRYQGEYLSQPNIADSIREWAPTSTAPDWYKDFLDRVVLPNWQLFAYCVVYFGFLVGVSFIIGFFVRPVALLAALVTLNFMFISGPEAFELHKLHFVLFLILAWVGAGRCLGMDYFFYKRDRGLWW
jgi:thiosulfate dehydrogenase [quinone] large subunit